MPPSEADQPFIHFISSTAEFAPLPSESISLAEKGIIPRCVTVKPAPNWRKTMHRSQYLYWEHRAYAASSCNGLIAATVADNTVFSHVAFTKLNTGGERK
jgi:hypothetical protein